MKSKWNFYKEIRPMDKCYYCDREIYIYPNIGKGVKIHTNIAQVPQVKYFCSDTCKNKFSILN